MLRNEFGEEFIDYEYGATTTGNTIMEQIKLFQKAKLVVGPHGAGLTNIVWTPPGLLFFSYYYSRERLTREKRNRNPAR